MKCGGEADAEKSVGCPLNRHESFIALEVVDWVGGAVVWLHVRHFEPTGNRLIEDQSRERLGGLEVDVVRRLLAVHLQLGESAVDLLEPSLVVVRSSMLGDPRSGASGGL